MALVGLYSFPKSGNTWLRRIIASAIGGGIEDIPDLHKQPLSQARAFKGFRFYKHHSGTRLTSLNGEMVAPTHVIHIRRNPLDVFVSYLNYVSNNVMKSAVFPFERVEEIAGGELFDIYFKTFITMGHIEPEFSAVTKSYFRHNAYWLSQACERVHCIRYEDMLRDPVASLSFLKDWLALSEGQLETMLEQAAAQTRPDGKFYWRQQEKNYFTFLTDAQVALFLAYRGAQCEQLGYDPAYLAKRP